MSNQLINDQVSCQHATKGFALDWIFCWSSLSLIHIGVVPRGWVWLMVLDSVHATDHKTIMSCLSQRSLDRRLSLDSLFVLINMVPQWKVSLPLAKRNAIDIILEGPCVLQRSKVSEKDIFVERQNIYLSPVIGWFAYRANRIASYMA